MICKVYTMFAWWDVYDAELAHIFACWGRYDTALAQHGITANAGSR